MRDGIVWCPHCGQPHRLEDAFCTKTGLPLDTRRHRESAARVEAGEVGFHREHALIGTVLEDQYRVSKLLGTGGQSHVFEAVRLSDGGVVAVKVMREKRRAEGAERLIREGSMVAAIQHPNICPVFGSGALPGGRPYLILERLFGETLADRLTTRRRLPPGAAVEIFSQILAGLGAAHAARILHRDLKPQNVFLVEHAGCAPVVKIVDFGFAQDMSGQSRITRPGRACGTPQYMSPEQILNAPLGTPSDIFAVGIMLFEALTGRHPFAGRSLLDVQLSIVNAQAPRLRSVRPNLPAALEGVVAVALEPAPSLRYRSAAEMQQALLDASKLPDLTDPAPASTTAPSIPRLWSSSSTATRS